MNVSKAKKVKKGQKGSNTLFSTFSLPGKGKKFSLPGIGKKFSLPGKEKKFSFPGKGKSTKKCFGFFGLFDLFRPFLAIETFTRRVNYL